MISNLYINISGGQIHDIHASFLHQYIETKEPMNIIISCGVENMVNGESPWSIIFQVRMLTRLLFYLFHRLIYATSDIEIFLFYHF